MLNSFWRVLSPTITLRPFENFVAMFSVVSPTIFFEIFAMFSAITFRPCENFFSVFSVVSAHTFVLALVAVFAVAVLPVEGFTALFADDHDATCTRHQMAIAPPMAKPQMKPPTR